MTQNTSQQEQRYALIMNGGGVKGIAFAGAIDELAPFYSFSAFIGTSAGAIAASFLACGMPPRDILDELRRLDFTSFLDGGFFHLFRRPRGLHPGLQAWKWVNTIISRRLSPSSPNPPDAKLGALPNRLIVFASSRRGSIAYDSETHKDTTVAKAVRASISIPFFFKPIEDEPNVFLFDGGLLNNFPIRRFIELEQSKGKTPSFIALYLTAQEGDGGLLSQIATTLIKKDEAADLDKYKDSIIEIDTAPINTTDFKLSDTQKKLLELRGRIAARTFIEKSGLLTTEHAKHYIDQTTSIRRELIETERILAAQGSRKTIGRIARHTIAATLVVGSLTLAATILSDDTSNLSTNSGFETGDTYGGVAGWSAINSETRLTRGSGRTSETSVCFSSSTPTVVGISQPIEVQPDEPLVVSGWIRAKNVVVRGGAQVHEGAAISVFDGLDRSKLWEDLGAPGTYDWRRFERRITPRNNQITIAIQLGDFAGDATGTACFDDILIERTNGNGLIQKLIHRLRRILSQE